MTASVVYPGEAAFEIEYPDNLGDLTSELGHVFEETQGGIAECIGHETQLDKKRKQGDRLRSSMVGDIFIIHNRYFIVAGVGWVEVSEETQKLWLSVPSRDRVMGWDWARKHHDLGLHIQVIC